jgi:cell division septal protein FtsQ
MPSFDHASRNNTADYWSAVTGILSIQIVVLFALSVAVIVYLNWSSKAAVREFMATGNPSVSEPSHLPQSSVPLQQVKSRTACPPRA